MRLVHRSLPTQPSIEAGDAPIRGVLRYATLHAVQASSTLAAVQERIAGLATVVGTLDAAPPALHRAVDALHGALAQRAEDHLPDRASSVQVFFGARVPYSCELVNLE